MTDRRLLLVPLVALLAGVAWWAWSDRSQTDDTPGTTRARDRDDDERAELSGSRPGEASPARRETERPQSGEPESYRRALGAVSGRLIWRTSREPIPGVEIIVIEAWLDTLAPSLEDVAATVQARSPIVFRKKTRTAADGTFTVRALHSRALLLLGIGLGTDKAALRLVERVPAPGEIVDLGDVALHERTTVSGRVVGSDGPVAGARVRVADLPALLVQLGVAHFDPEGLLLIEQGAHLTILEMPPWARELDAMAPFPEARTGTDGSFTVAGVRPGQATAVVRVRGREPATRNLRVRRQRPSRLGTLRVRDGTTLEGRLVNAAGEPVTGARVTAGAVVNMASVGFLGRPAAVDAEGRFRLAGLPRGRLWLCYQPSPGAPWVADGPHHGGDRVRIVLPEPRVGFVRVEDVAGKRIADARIALQPVADAAFLPGLERRFDTAKHVRKDTTRPGTWRVIGLPPGEYRVVVRAAGFALGTALLDLRPAGASPETVVRLAPAALQAFTAHDHAGRPVAAARVYWNAKDGRSSAADSAKGGKTRLSRLAILLGKTDASGRLETTSIESGASSFLCRHPAFALASSGAQTTGAGRTIRFVLREGGHVTGLLTENGAPPEDAWTVLAAPRLDAPRQSVLMPRFALSQPDGSFEMRHLDPGQWRVAVLPRVGDATRTADLFDLYMGSAGDRGSRTVTVRESATTRVHIELAGAARRAGDGAITGFVWIGGDPKPGIALTTRFGGRKRQTATGADGAFLLDGLPAGEHRLSVGSDAGQLWSGTIDLAKGERRTLQLTFAVAEVTVRVVDGAGNPLPGLLLTMRGKTGARTGRVARFGATDGSGRVRFPDVPQGSYRFHAASPRDASWVLPPNRFDVTAESARIERDLVARKPIEIRGFVEWDVTALAPAERAFAAARPLDYLVLESSGRYVWGKVTRAGERHAFRIPGVSEGTWRFVKGGPLGWSAPDLDVPAAGLPVVRVRMTPNAKKVGELRGRK